MVDSFSHSLSSPFVGYIHVRTSSLSLSLSLKISLSSLLYPSFFFSLFLFHRLHEFEWHGTDPTNKTRKVPGALKFTKLRVIPDQFYYNIDDVSMWERGGLEGVRWRGEGWRE